MSNESRVAAAFGSALRQLRAEAGLSQERLANHSSLDRTYISLLERGLRQPSLDTMVRLAASLGVDLPILTNRFIEEFEGDREA